MENPARTTTIDLPTRLVVRVLQDLVARDHFDSYADLSEALKVRCARLKIPYHAGLIAEAIAQLERGGRMPLIPRPKTIVHERSAVDEPPPSTDEAREILQRLGCQVRTMKTATWRDPEQTRRDYDAARERAYAMGVELSFKDFLR